MIKKILPSLLIIIGSCLIFFNLLDINYKVEKFTNSTSSRVSFKGGPVETNYVGYYYYNLYQTIFATLGLALTLSGIFIQKELRIKKEKN